MVAADRPARRVLDVGCGDATYLSEALAALPDACGVGVELDGRVVELACKVIAERGLSERAEVFEGDICGVDLDGSFDLVLCLQVIYYIPESDRPSLFARLRALLRPGGTLVLAFLGRGNDPTATHYDLIFRMTAGLSRLPDPSVIAEQLTAAGFASTELLSLLPGQPLYGVVAEVPS
jgi:SAM-dependent methyltransferase